LAEMKNLTSLSLPYGVTDAGLTRLAGLTNLTTLDLSMTMVKGYDGSLKHLAGLKRITTLSVNLREVSFSSVAAAGLLHALPQATAADGKRPNEPEDVVTLDLHDQWVFDFSLPPIAAFKNLTTLDLSGTSVSGTGLKDLTSLKNLTELKLGPGGNFPVTDAALEHVAAFDNLTAFTLHSRRVTDVGLKHLSGLKNLKTLKFLPLGKNEWGVTGKGIAELQEALPNCKIEW
jgi:internalin A